MTDATTAGYAHEREDDFTTLGQLLPGTRYRYVNDDDGVYEVLWHASTGAVWVSALDFPGRQQHLPELEVFPV